MATADVMYSNSVEDNKCPVCCSKYDAENHVAKILHCGHVFCLQCLMQSMIADRDTQNRIWTCTNQCSLCPYVSSVYPNNLATIISTEHLNNKVYVLNACRTITNNVFNMQSCFIDIAKEYKKKMFAMTSFLDILSIHWHDPNIPHHVCFVIHAMVCMDPSYGQKEEICEYFLRMTNLFMNDAWEIACICRAMQQMCKNDDYCRLLSCVCCHCTTILSRYSNSGDVVSACCGFIVALCRNEENCASLGILCRQLRSIYSTSSAKTDIHDAMVALSKNANNYMQLEDLID